MSARTAAASNAQRVLEQRCQRLLGRLGKMLNWSPGERDRWRDRLQAARSVAGGEAGRLGRQLFQLAPRLRTPASRAEARRLAALYRLAHDVARAADAGGAFGAALTAVRDGLEFETATGLQLDPVTRRLTPAGVFGEYVDLAADFQFDHGAGLSSWVVKSRRPILLASLRRDGEEVTPERIASFLCVPVIADDEVIGVLSLGHRRAGAFDTADRDLLLLAGRLLAETLVERGVSVERQGSGADDAERLLAQRVGEEARAARHDSMGFTLIGLAWPGLVQPEGGLCPPADLRHRVVEWARQTGGREASAYPLGGDAVVLLLPRHTPQATRRLAAQLREGFRREWGSLLPALNLATVLYPQDAETGPGALQRLRHLLATPGQLQDGRPPKTVLHEFDEPAGESLAS